MTDFIVLVLLGVSIFVIACVLIIEYINYSIAVTIAELEMTINTMLISGATGEAIKEYLSYYLKNRRRN